MIFTVTDVSTLDDCGFGFRKMEPFQATIDGYDEHAILNVITGNITQETILNGGSATVTDTTLNWADGETHELMVKVSAAGVVTFYVDGSVPATVTAFTFDDAEVVMPFLMHVHVASSTAGLILKEFECGLQ
jgi:hypothetical protein